MKRLLTALFMTACLASPAHAAGDPVALGQYGEWVAVHFTDTDGHKNCFMQSAPEKSEPAGAKRGLIRFFVTHWSGEGKKNVVSIAFGYPLKTGSAPEVQVDGQTFAMAKIGDGKTSDEREMAWTEDQKTDDALAAALQKGSSLTVRGVSQRGTKTTDTYSLKGSAEAYRAISKECGF